MVDRPFGDIRPFGPFFSQENNGGIEDGDTLFIDDEEAFLNAIRNVIENHPEPNVTVIRETQEAVDIRIDAVDKQQLIRATK